VALYSKKSEEMATSTEQDEDPGDRRREVDSFQDLGIPGGGGAPVDAAFEGSIEEPEVRASGSLATKEGRDDEAKSLTSSLFAFS
jgi:hypothetical protein